MSYNSTLTRQPIIPQGGYNAIATGVNKTNGAPVQNTAPTQSQYPIIDAASYEQPDYEIYNKAINVSDPKELAGDDNPPCPVIRKKVLRRVEVPFTRQVKVPTQTVQIVPTFVEQKVPVKKLVAVPGYKVIDEVYTDYEEREVIREKEIWVKKVVPERFIEKVPIQRVRQVQKPTTVIKEVEAFETVQVPATKKVTVDGYRVDEVQDSKVVEVEEFQDYAPEYKPVGPPQISATRDIGRLDGIRHGRTVGANVYAPDHPALAPIDNDNQPDASAVPGNTATTTLRGQYGPAPTSFNNTYAQSSLTRAGAAITSASNSSFYRPSSPTSRNLNIQGTGSLPPLNQEYGPFGGRDGESHPQRHPGVNYLDPKSTSAAGQYRKPATSSRPDETDTKDLSSDPDLRSLGLVVDETHTRHTDGTGVQVTKVTRGGPAARGGIQPHDIITSINGVPTTTVDEFLSAVRATPGPLSASINRDGRRNVMLTLNR